MNYRFLIGLVLCLALVCPQLSAQEKQGCQLLASTEMYAKRALSGDPKAASFCCELVPGVRFNNSIQLEIPFGLGVSFEQKGDHVLARQGYAGSIAGANGIVNAGGTITVAGGNISSKVNIWVKFCTILNCRRVRLLHIDTSTI